MSLPHVTSALWKMGARALSPPSALHRGVTQTRTKTKTKAVSACTASQCKAPRALSLSPSLSLSLSPSPSLPLSRGVRQDNAPDDSGGDLQLHAVHSVQQQRDDFGDQDVAWVSVTWV